MRKVKWNWFVAALLVAAVLSTAPSAPAQPQGVVARGERPAIDEATKAAVVDSLCQALNDIYVFPDVAKDMEKTIRRNLRKGDYKEADTYDVFAGMINDDMYEIAKDRHLHIDPVREGAPVRRSTEPTPEEEQELFDRLASNNFGFHRVERLPGNVGYLDLRGFNDAKYAGATAIAAMNLLAYTDAVIIDLRRNGGGSPSMIQLISSYFFEDPVHLNSFYIRADDTMKQFWSHSYVEGPRMTHTDLYILTSSYTFSAAEEFTYNMKNLERATIVGETTGGGAHPVSYVTWDGIQMSASVPFGRAINPISGTNWEGTGIEPHIQVPEGEALDAAHVHALRKLAEREGADPGLAWDIERIEARANPVSVDEAAMRRYAGQYGPRAVSFEGGSLYYQRGQGPKMRMVPINQTTFIFDELDFFKLEFELDASGEPVAVIGHYRQGRVDRNPRD